MTRFGQRLLQNYSRCRTRPRPPLLLPIQQSVLCFKRQHQQIKYFSCQCQLNVIPHNQSGTFGLMRDDRRWSIKRSSRYRSSFSSDLDPSNNEANVAVDEEVLQHDFFDAEMVVSPMHDFNDGQEESFKMDSEYSVTNVKQATTKVKSNDMFSIPTTSRFHVEPICASDDKTKESGELDFQIFVPNRVGPMPSDNLYDNMFSIPIISDSTLKSNHQSDDTIKELNEPVSQTKSSDGVGQQFDDIFPASVTSNFRFSSVSDKIKNKSYMQKKNALQSKLGYTIADIAADLHRLTKDIVRQLDVLEANGKIIDKEPRTNMCIDSILGDNRYRNSWLHEVKQRHDHSSFFDNSAHGDSHDNQQLVKSALRILRTLSHNDWIKLRDSVLMDDTGCSFSEVKIMKKAPMSSIEAETRVLNFENDLRNFEKDIEIDSTFDVQTNAKRLVETVVEHHDNKDDDNVDNSRGVKDKLRTHSLLKFVELGMQEFSSAIEYNLLLLRLCIDINISDEVLLKTLMMLYERIIGHLPTERTAEDKLDLCDIGPNDFTHEIMFLVMGQRLNSPSLGVDLIQNVRTKIAWEMCPNALLAALTLYQSRSERESAWALVLEACKKRKANFLAKEVPVGSYSVLIEMAKSDFRSQEAIAALKLCLNMQGVDFYDNRMIDRLVSSIAFWPSHDRNGISIENTDVFEMLIPLLEEYRATYRPSFYLWNIILSSIAYGATKNISRWGLFTRALSCFSSDYPYYWPDESLLHNGLIACEVTSNCKLAAELISRRFPDRTSAEDRLSLTYSSSVKITDVPVPFDVIKKALNLCLKNNDLKSFRSILATVESNCNKYPANVLNELFDIGVKGFAAHGDPKTAQTLALATCKVGLLLSEEAFGAVIKSLAVNRNPSSAIDFFNQLTGSKDVSIPTNLPGASCYEGLVIAYINSKDWKKALQTYKSLQTSGITPLPTMYQHLLHACYTTGGAEQLRKLLGELLQLRSTMSLDGYFVAIGLLIPELSSFDEFLELPHTVTGFTKMLRRLAVTSPEKKDVLINLCRLLRIAEQECTREPFGAVTQANLDERRHESLLQLNQLLVQDDFYNTTPETT